MARADRGTTGTATRQSTEALLAAAADQLEDALERVDLENDPRLADQIIEAMEATDDAAALAADGDARHDRTELPAR